MVEEVAKMLTANNPNAPENIIRYNIKEKCFKPAAIIEQAIVAYSSEGWVVHQVGQGSNKRPSGAAVVPRLLIAAPALPCSPLTRPGGRRKWKRWS